MNVRIGDTVISLESEESETSSQSTFYSTMTDVPMGNANDRNTANSLNDLASVLAHQLSQQAPWQAEVMPNPERYDDSERIRYPHFRSYLSAKLEIDGSKLGNESVQVWYALGRLSGQAAVRMTLWAETNRGTDHFTVEGFFNAMDSAFSDRMSREKAMERLGRIRQGKREFSDFIGEFDRLLLEAGSDGWAEISKIAQLRNALNDDMKDLSVSVVEEGRTYTDFCSRLHSLATKLEARKRERSGARSLSWAPVMREGNSHAYRREPMEWEYTNAAVKHQPNARASIVSGNKEKRLRAKWVSQQMREERRRLRLCMRCGANDYFVANCQALPPPNPENRQEKVSRAYIAPLLEDDEENPVDNDSGN